MKIISANEVVGTAIELLDLDSSARCTAIELVDGIYEMEIRTLFMKYEIYMDSITAEILGLNYEPHIDEYEVATASILVA